MRTVFFLIGKQSSNSWPVFKNKYTHKINYNSNKEVQKYHHVRYLHGLRSYCHNRVYSFLFPFIGSEIFLTWQGLSAWLTILAWPRTFTIPSSLISSHFHIKKTNFEFLRKNKIILKRWCFLTIPDFFVPFLVVLPYILTNYVI